MLRASRLFIAVLGLVLAIVCAEVLLRQYAEFRAASYTGIWVGNDELESDPVIGYRPKSNYRSASGRSSHDSRGFRLNGEPRDEIGPEPIVVMNGSTAYGWGLPDHLTLQALIEVELKRQGREQTVLNGGVPGFSSLQSLLHYERNVRGFQPLIVVLLSGVNDLFFGTDEHWANRVYEIGLGARRAPELRPVVEAVDRHGLGFCYTCYYVASSTQTLYERTRMQPVGALAEVLGHHPAGKANPKELSLAAWAIGEMARRVERDGGCFVLVWQPVLPIDRKQFTSREIELLGLTEERVPNARLVMPAMHNDLRGLAGETLAGTSAAVYDFRHVFIEMQDAAYSDAGSHYTEAGQRILAKHIEQAILESPCLQAA